MRPPRATCTAKTAKATAVKKAAATAASSALQPDRAKEIKAPEDAALAHAGLGDRDTDARLRSPLTRSRACVLGMGGPPTAGHEYTVGPLAHAQALQRPSAEFNGRMVRGGRRVCRRARSALGGRRRYSASQTPLRPARFAPSTVLPSHSGARGRPGRAERGARGSSSALLRRLRARPRESQKPSGYPERAVRRFLVIVFALVGIGSLLAAPGASGGRRARSSTVVRVDLAAKRQVMQGFGSSVRN